MAYLDETNGRPVQQKFLDLMPLKPKLKEEVLSALHKIPELKLRPEKIPEEENVVKPLSWKNFKDFPYLDPVPSSMLHVDIRELSNVNIDWKMLTLDRPETQFEIQIFNRMVYLDKLMLKCVIEENQKKIREKYVRLRTKGRPKPPVDSDNDKSEEFTYEYFSRFYGGNERAQAMEEMPKPAAEDKPRPLPSADVQHANKNSISSSRRRSRRLHAKKKVRRRKRKKRKKTKLRKRKLAVKPKLKVGQKPKKFIPPYMRKPKKSKFTGKTKKKLAGTGSRINRKAELKKSNKTLVQILKSSEIKEKRKPDSGRKPLISPKKT